jgi:hypothetical protein
VCRQQEGGEGSGSPQKEPEWGKPLTTTDPPRSIVSKLQKSQRIPTIIFSDKLCDEECYSSLDVPCCRLTPSGLGLGFEGVFAANTYNFNSSHYTPLSTLFAIHPHLTLIFTSPLLGFTKTRFDDLTPTVKPYKTPNIAKSGAKRNLALFRPPNSGKLCWTVN